MDINKEQVLGQSNVNQCPLRNSIHIIGGKWKLIIIRELYRNEIIRFNELKKAVDGITNTMLSNCLEDMQKDNLIKRVQYNEMPLRVEYSLTNIGKSLLPILLELSKWGNSQMDSNKSVKESF
jgi:DNA-binding HxlR family transcriptional regulator